MGTFADGMVVDCQEGDLRHIDDQTRVSKGDCSWGIRPETRRLVVLGGIESRCWRVSEDFLKSLKGFWGAVCAEIGKYWAEETVKPLIWVESMFDFASDAEKNAVISHPSTRGLSPSPNIAGTVPTIIGDSPR